MQQPSHHSDSTGPQPAADPVNVVCLKWGDRYPSAYVNKLARGVAKHLKRPHRITCFTDDPTGIDPAIQTRPLEPLEVIPRLHRDIFLKISLLHQHSGLVGPTLFIDLDVIIMGPMDDFFDYQPERFCIIHNWVAPHKQILRARPDIGNSSLFRFLPGTCDHALDRYLKEPDHAYNDFPTEQAFMTDCVRDQKVYWPQEWVRSFKFNCRPVFPLNLLNTPRVPPGTRVLVFHGRPDPDQAIAGYRGKLRHTTRPAPQLAEHWS